MSNLLQSNEMFISYDKVRKSHTRQLSQNSKNKLKLEPYVFKNI